MTDRLVSHPERNARQALETVIERAKNDCAAFDDEDAKLDWASPMWDITKHCPRPANKAHNVARLYFTTHEGGTSKSMAGRIPLAEPFGSLIKAIVRLKQDASPQTADPLARIINAARDLELELRDRDGDPCLLLNEDFDAAVVRVVRRSDSPKTRYRLGCALEEISEFIDRHALTPLRLDWRNTIKRVSNNRDRTTDHAAEARQNNLPDDDLLEAFADIWNAVENPRDVIPMGVMVLLHCAPWRIVEALSLVDDCERTETKMDARGPVLGRDGKAIERYGIAYWTEKSGEPDIKWVPTVMAEAAQKAIERIREATAPARLLARWLHENPGRAWLPGPDLGPDQLYTVRQIHQMLGLAKSAGARTWLRSRKVPFRHGLEATMCVRRVDLEAALLAEMPVLPQTSREAPLHERLFITYRGTFHGKKGTNPCVLQLVKDQNIRDFIGGRQVVESGFERFLDRPDLRARTHMLRHWLNTLAQRGGVEQALIARWSGRDDVQQNGEYDHMTATELAEVARDLMATGKVFGAIADIHVALPPADRASFRETVLETVHITDIGFCLQNWNTSPCPEFGACTTCGACALLKGDPKQKERAIKLRDDTDWTVKRIRAEMDEDTLGASNHYKAANDMLAAVNHILAVHDDADIPDGTLVQPNPTSPVHYGGRRLGEAA